METLQFKKGYINNEILRKSFEDFALKTFVVHYGAWHEDGLWNEKSNYINYSYFNDNEIAANVSVNEFTLIVEGVEKHAVQLGAVMTKEKYRNKNLIKTLMEKIFEDYAGKADFFYLFGHEGVLDFYTKFGFKRTKMNSFKINSQDVCHKKAGLRKLNVEKDWPLIDELTDGRVPVSKTLGIINDQWPLKVYCKRMFAEALYYLPEDDAIVILEKTDDTLTIHDVISSRDFSVDDIIEKIGGQAYKWINLGFTADLKRYKAEVGVIDEDEDAFFTKNFEKSADYKFILPITSHT